MLLVANAFAGAFANAPLLAMRQYDERHEDAQLALEAASALAEIAHRVRCTVEMVGSVSAGGGMGT